MIMITKKIICEYSEFNSIEDLDKSDKELLERAIEVTANAYSPYSNFNVGASIRLSNGEIICGSNQENAAYPSGLCAERVAMFYASSRFPNIPFETMAIAANSKYINVDKPITPCGSCRQVMIEYEFLSKKNIRLILYGNEGKVFIINSFKDLVPFPFVPENLK